MLLEELRALRGAVEGMGGRLVALERENRELRELLQLGAAPDQDRREELEVPAEPAAQDSGPEHEARPLKDWTADVQAQDSGRDRSQGGLWRRVGRWIGLGGS